MFFYIVVSLGVAILALIIGGCCVSRLVSCCMSPAFLYTLWIFHSNDLLSLALGWDAFEEAKFSASLKEMSDIFSTFQPESRRNTRGDIELT